jgi:energy-coupling factor transport system substrate-specific component
MITIRSSRLRAWLRWLIPLVLIPLLVAMGALLFPQKRHLLVSLGVAVLSLLLFLCGFERRQTGSRRMVLAAVLTALCIAGRFLPLVKPVAAVAILAGMYLGGESGFLVGSLAAVLSNFYFGQGPWTPFQMLAWGLIGLCAGLLGAPLKKSRPLLLFFGLLAGIAYSLVMDVWTVLWYDGGFRWQLYLSAMAAALPHTLVYAAGNLLFLWLLAKPVGKKLERIRIKYGL